MTTNAKSKGQKANQLPIPNIDKALLKKTLLAYQDGNIKFEACQNEHTINMRKFEKAVNKCESKIEESKGKEVEAINVEYNKSTASYVETVALLLKAYENYNQNPEGLIQVMYEFPLHQEDCCDLMHELVTVVNEFEATNPECFA